MNRYHMRGFLIGLMLSVLPGCALTRLLLSGDDDQPTKVVCTAHYTPVLPNVAVGADSCGNRWLWQDGRCWYYLPKDGIVVEIECPAEGDTTYAE